MLPKSSDYTARRTRRVLGFVAGALPLPAALTPSGLWPPVGAVRMGALRRLSPVSSAYGFDRGLPVDRFYIEDFLGRFAAAPDYGAGDIRGRILEVGDDHYGRKFGSLGEGGSASNEASGSHLDVLHVTADNSAATVVGDLTTGEGLQGGVYDCVIATQTLHVIYDFRAAIRTLERILRPGGVVLATFPGITQRCNPDRDYWGDYWRFTSLSARRLFEEAFPAANVSVEAYGNVLSTVAFLHGLAAGELTAAELEPRDPNYELLIAVRASKQPER